MNVTIRCNDRSITAATGQSLRDALVPAGLCSGTCDSAMICTTCAVRLTPDWGADCTPSSDEEDDVLDVLPDRGPGDRLSCQLIITPAHDGLTCRTLEISD